MKEALVLIIGVLAFAYCWHLVLNEIDYRIRARRSWEEIERRIKAGE